MKKSAAHLTDIGFPYLQKQEFRTTLKGLEIRYFSKPGLPDWNLVTPASILLAENVPLPPKARLLLLGCGHGAVATALARQLAGGEIWLMDTSFIALQMSTATLQLNRVENATIVDQITVLPAQAGAFDVVTLELPKGRKLAQRWLVEAHQALRTGGELFAAGPNDQGIKSVIKDAEALFGQGSVIQYKKGNRIVRLVKDVSPSPAPSWVQEPGIAPGTWVKLSIAGTTEPRIMHSLPGIFSYDRLDDGTALLLNSLGRVEGERVLDLGCGYGILGVSAAQMGAASVDLVDANLLAVVASRENLARYALKNAQVFPSDGLSAVLDHNYSLIITNPPFHTGKGVDYQVAGAFIEQSWNVLEPGGQFWWVSNQFIHYEPLLERRFSQVIPVVQDGRYHVWRAIK